MFAYARSLLSLALCARQVRGRGQEIADARIKMIEKREKSDAEDEQHRCKNNGSCISLLAIS